MRDLPASGARFRETDKQTGEGLGSGLGTIGATRQTAAEPGQAADDADAEIARLNGTLGAARIMLAKLEFEVRWARRHRGLRQFLPAALRWPARLWSKGHEVYRDGGVRQLLAATLLLAARMWRKVRNVHRDRGLLPILAAALPWLVQRWSNKQARKVRRSGLFDAGWYLWSNPDVEASGVDPLRHYLRIGWKEGRDPSPFFSVVWYLEVHPDVRAKGEEPLSHYVDPGAVEGRDPHPLFKGNWYLQQNNDVAESGANPLFHYVAAGGVEGRDPHPWFRTEWYLAQNPDVARSGLNPLFHYIVCGAAEGRDTHPWFKSGWYLAPLRTEPRLGPAGQAEGPLPARRPPALPPALGQLLRMFHDESVVPVIESCNALLQRAREPKVAALVEQAARLAERAGHGATDTTVVIMAGSVSDTLCSLYSVLSLRTKIQLEILVVSDDTSVAALVARIGGIVRHATRDTWPGVARGQVLAFLGAGVIVLPGWLDELTHTLRSDASIGLVGSKRVGPDGTLQGFGDLADPCAPQCNYFKDVAAVSASSMAISKALWERLGLGLATHDFAARVRANGLRVVYQPFSAVIYDGPMDGTEPAGEPQARQRPRILVMDHSVPQPDRDAGSRSAVQYLKIFARAGFEVTCWPQDLYFDRPYVMALQRAGIEVIYGWAGVWPEFDTWLARNGSTLDYAYLSRPTCAVNFIDRLRAHSKAKVLFAGVDVHFKRLEMEAAQSGNTRIRNDARRMERLEKDIWRKSDVVHYLSDSETDLVRATCPGTTARSLPIFMFDRAQLRRAAERVRQSGIPAARQLFFVGGFRHSPNVDAMVWFAGEIWPRILAAVPDARLTIAGSSPPPAIRRLASAAITVSGAISDEELIRRYTEVTMAIVPLRFGAGVKGKLLEAMSYGAPVVTTSVGMQGLAGAEPFVDVADDAPSFADAVIEILEAPGSRIEKVAGGLGYLEQNLTEAAALRVLAEDIAELRAYRDRTLP